MAPKKSDDKLLEELVEVEQWARANLQKLRSREGDCFKAKLRQLEGGEEKRIYKFLAYHQKRLEASAALAAKLAKLDCMVMVPGDTGLHADVPSAASGSRKTRSATDAGMSAKEEDKKRKKMRARNSCGTAGTSKTHAKTRARGQTDSVGRSDAACQLKFQPSNESYPAVDHHRRSNSPEGPADHNRFGDGDTPMRPFTRDGWCGEKKKHDDKKIMLLQVRRIHFEAIKSKRKRWEARPLVERRKDGSYVDWRLLHLATEGRVVKFQSGPPPNLVMRVAEVRFFVPNERSAIPPEQAMVMDLGTDLLPDVADASDSAQVYREMYGTDVCAHGFLAMRLKCADETKAAAESSLASLAKSHHRRAERPGGRQEASKDKVG